MEINEYRDIIRERINEAIENEPMEEQAAFFHVAINNLAEYSMADNIV